MLQCHPLCRASRIRRGQLTAEGHEGVAVLVDVLEVGARDSWSANALQSQEDLGFEAELDRTYFSRIERGVRNPTLTSVLKIAKALGVPSSRLIRQAESYEILPQFRAPFPHNLEMSDLIPGAEEFVEEVQRLRREREVRKAEGKRRGARRRSLRPSDRAAILEKTGGRCHICGGDIDGRWDADHVLAHSGGGEHSADNYLASHHLCNNYRWDYLPVEFQLILKLGVMARTEIEKETGLGRQLAAKFTQRERQRVSRRVK